MLHPFMSCDFIGPTTVKQLILLPKGKAICIDPCSVNTMERCVQIFLVILRAFDQGNIWKFCDLLCTGRVDIASQDSNSEAFA